MKRILLFITATLLLVPGTSCSDDNTGCNPTSDELGILYKDGHDVYGVEVWEETSVILTIIAKFICTDCKIQMCIFS